MAKADSTKPSKASVPLPKRILTNIAAESADNKSLVCPDCAHTKVYPILKVGDLPKCQCGVMFDIVDYRAVSDPDELKGWLTKAEGQLVATDIETMSPTGDHIDPYSGVIVGQSFCYKPGRAIYVPIRHAVGKCMAWDTFKSIVGPWLRDNPSAVHNAGGMEWKWFYLHLGIEPKIEVDTIIVAALDDPNRSHRFDPRSLALKELAKELWDIRVTKYENIVRKDQNFGFVDLKTAVPYGCQDSDLTIRLHNQLTDRVRTRQPLIFKLEHEIIAVVASMSLRGFKLNGNFLVDSIGDMDKEIEGYERDTFKLMGFDPPDDSLQNWDRPFDLGSPKRVSEQLFHKMGLPYDERSVGASGLPSSSKEALEDYRQDYPVADCLCKWREASHMRNNFLAALPEYINKVTGYIHGSFNQTGVPTGRFSHSSPNTSAIPKKR